MVIYVVKLSSYLLQYTNADSLLNKIGELEVLIGIVKPNYPIIAIIIYWSIVLEYRCRQLFH